MIQGTPPQPARPSLRVLHVDSGQEWRSTRDQVSLLLAGLRRYPHVQQAVATLARSRLAVEARRMGIPVIPLPWAAGTDPRALRTLARHARQDWSLFHGHDSHALRMMLYLAALEGSPTRIVASRRIPGPPRSVWKWRRANLVLATADSVRDALVARGVERGRVVVVPNGLDASGMEPRRRGGIRQAARAAESHFLIGSLAALAPDRDHATLLRAAALVTARYPDARFVLFGEGHERPRLEKLIETLGLGGRACLPGYLPDARLSIADLDLFIMPSLWEEMATACLEAMWAGVPAVMVAEGDGRLRAEGIEPVRRGDHAGLAGVIGRFIEDEEYRRRMGEDARKSAAVHSAGEMVGRTLKAYGTALTARAR
jgi:glycosyltransferase involved in cell wall biosynthesis